MNQKQRDEIGMSLAKCALFYDRSDLDKSKISLMIDVMIDAFPNCSFEDFSSAILQYRNDTKNTAFPSPSKLSKYLTPEISIDAQAQEITSRIVLSISKYGYGSAKEVQAFVGELGWVVVKRLGGWQYLCQEHGVSIDPGAFYAQTRELVKTHIEIQNKPNLDMTKLLSGKSEETRSLPEPVKFSEEETNKIGQLMQGQPKEVIDNYIQALAKKKSLSI